MLPTNADRAQLCAAHSALQSCLCDDMPYACVNCYELDKQENQPRSCDNAFSIQPAYYDGSPNDLCSHWLQKSFAALGCQRSANKRVCASLWTESSKKASNEEQVKAAVTAARKEARPYFATICGGEPPATEPGPSRCQRAQVHLQEGLSELPTCSMRHMCCTGDAIAGQQLQLTSLPRSALSACKKLARVLHAVSLNLSMQYLLERFTGAAQQHVKLNKGRMVMLSLGRLHTCCHMRLTADSGQAAQASW